MSKNDGDLDDLLSTVKRFSNDVGIQFDLEKMFESHNKERLGCKF